MQNLMGLIALTWALSSCYSIKQAYWFNNAYNSRITVDSVLDEGMRHTSKFPRKKLALSREVLRYAEEEGLNVGGSYQHYIPEENSQVSYYVQAAYADRLESKTWWFPIVGRVPYLGFFDVRERDDMAQTLRSQGFDVSIGSVGAFSSLGWFDDPIYASMTKRSDPDFIQLIFHELAHRTYWSAGSIIFNENLAEFVGLQLAENFLIEMRGGQGLDDLRTERADQERLRIWLQELKAALTVVYNQENLTTERRLQLKEVTITKYRNELFPEMATKRYAAIRDRPWNNASILGATLYSPDTERFSRALSCLGPVTMGSFLLAVKNAESKLRSAEKALDSLCEKAS